MTRVRDALQRHHPREQRMFGGIAFMVDDKMVASVSKRGLLLRVGKDGQEAALQDPRAKRLEMRPGRVMSGYVRIAAEELSAAHLKQWLDVGLKAVRALKEGKASPARSRRASTSRPARRSKA